MPGDHDADKPAEIAAPIETAGVAGYLGWVSPGNVFGGTWGLAQK